LLGVETGPLMQPRTGTWAEVKPGTYIADATGKIWKVEAFDAIARKIHLLDSAGQRASIAPKPRNDVVTIMEATESEAATTVQGLLGAELIGSKTEGSGWRCPPFPTRLGPMARTHMMMMHGIYTVDVKSYAEIRAAHDEAHANPDLHFASPHTHP
jgi:hypothetical protein